MTANSRPSHLEQIHSALGPLIPSGAPLALLDFPNYSNVGDSAIWLGEVQYLRSRQPNSRVVWTSDTSLGNWPILPELSKSTVLLINGGGNLGDLWPRHQMHRERVVRHYRRHRVIQLPQSIHFQNPRNADRCREAFNGHPDFHLLVRDHVSLDLGYDLHKGHTHHCPDMALCLGDLPRRKRPARDIVALMRTDKEKALSGNLDCTANGVFITDWLHEPRTLAQRLDRFLTRYPNFSRHLRPHVYHWLAWERLRRGCRILESGRVAITNRLHAHILCTLLGIPHVVLDNTYRKIGNFRDAWHTGEGLCETAETFDEALEIARGMLARHSNSSLTVTH